MLSRKQKENAIAKRISPSDKKGRGIHRVIMLTGNLAKKLNVPSYTTMRMIDFTDRQIDTLYQTLYGKVASRSEEARLIIQLQNIAELSYVVDKVPYTGRKISGEIILLKSRMSQVYRLYWIIASETDSFGRTDYHVHYATVDYREAKDMVETVRSNYQR